MSASLTVDNKVHILQNLHNHIRNKMLEDYV